MDVNYQLDFVDVGLLPAIEGEIHIRLDRLLTDSITEALKVYSASNFDAKDLFRATFRFMAAKVLSDRRHKVSKDWDSNDINSVLRTIEEYYTLDKISTAKSHGAFEALETVWNSIRNGINFRNISASNAP